MSDLFIVVSCSIVVMDCLVLNLIQKASENVNNSNRIHQAKNKLSFVRRSLLKVYLYTISYATYKSIEGVNFKLANDKLAVL